MRQSLSAWARPAGELSPRLAWVLVVGLAALGLALAWANFGSPITALYATGGHPAAAGAAVRHTACCMAIPCPQHCCRTPAPDAQHETSARCAVVSHGWAEALKATAAGLALGTVYSVPPFRLKRFAITAFLIIATVRGFLLNFGVFTATRAALGLPFVWSPAVMCAPLPVWLPRWRTCRPCACTGADLSACQADCARRLWGGTAALHSKQQRPRLSCCPADSSPAS